MQLLFLACFAGLASIYWASGASGAGGHMSCDRDFYKLGCFKDSRWNKTMPELLITDRDHSSPEYKKPIDWDNWDDYLHGLACRCATKARSSNYSMFGLQFYGECWGGYGSCGSYAKYGGSQHCYGQNYTRCDNDADSECVGGANANYVYLVMEWATACGRK